MLLKLLLKITSAVGSQDSGYLVILRAGWGRPPEGSARGVPGGWSHSVSDLSAGYKGMFTL